MRATRPRPHRLRHAWVLLGIPLAGLLLGLGILLGEDAPDVPVHELSLSATLRAIDDGQAGDETIAAVAVDAGAGRVTLETGGAASVDGCAGGPGKAQRFLARYPTEYGDRLVERLEAAGLCFTAVPGSGSSSSVFLVALLVVGALVGLGAIVLTRRNGDAPLPGGGRNGLGGLMGFTRSRTEVSAVPETRFSDVVGCDEAVEELSEVVELLHDPARFRAAGANVPRGFLLVGPPGTGKTLLARAVAGEAGVPFYSAAGSDFTEMFVGVGASRVRDLFGRAKKTGGIVFIDEIDSVGRARHGAMANPGSDEREGTLNALLVEMDGFDKDSNIIVMAATNRPDVLDPALLRAGRFDRTVSVTAPDRRGRTRLLEFYTRDLTVGPDVDFVALARRTPGLTGADVANLCNQAALESARRRTTVITAAHFGEALATVVMGRARRSAVVTDRDRRITAWHEAGHTVTALALDAANDPVQVTIVPRGHAGGVTWMSGDDHSFKTRTQAVASLVVAMGGRAAEEILLDGDHTQGAAGDFADATNLAMQMVTSWGMSSLGVVSVDPERSWGPLAERINQEVAVLLDAALVEARALVATHVAFIEAVVEELLDEDTVDCARLLAIWAEVYGNERPPVGSASEPGDRSLRT